MRLKHEPARCYGLELCPDCGQNKPLSQEESEEMNNLLRIRWQELTRDQQMSVLQDRIRAGMEAYELTPAEAHRVWEAGLSALICLRPTALGEYEE